MLLGLAHRVCHHVKQSLLYICFFSIDLFHCIKSNVLSRRLPILLWLFVTFIIFHFPIGKKLWGGPSPKTPTELMIVLQRFLTPHFFHRTKSLPFFAQPRPFQWATCSVLTGAHWEWPARMRNEVFVWYLCASQNHLNQLKTYQGRWAYLMVGPFPLPEILCWLLW